MKELNFTNRETYIIWRAEWRTEYKELSQTIRDTKIKLKNEFRETGYTDLNWDLIQLRREATQMLGLRCNSKIMAQEQYLQNKLKVA
jgi:hypothetical protein